MAASAVALHDDLPTNEDGLDAEPAMLAAIQLVEKAASLFEGNQKHSCTDGGHMQGHVANEVVAKDSQPRTWKVRLCTLKRHPSDAAVT